MLFFSPENPEQSDAKTAHKAFEASLTPPAAVVRQLTSEEIAADARDSLFLDALANLSFLQLEFERLLSEQAISVDVDYAVWSLQRAKEALQASPFVERGSQFFVFVDRNPEAQIALLGFYNAETDVSSPVGWTHVSTGDGSLAGHYETPMGVFRHLIEVGYRAEGTPNEATILGLGVAGMRVFDLGWQTTEGENGPREIRVVMHATDPVIREPALGEPASRGCIRIPSGLNTILDIFGLLDAEEDKARKGLLQEKRIRVSHPGNTVIVGDSRELQESPDER